MSLDLVPGNIDQADYSALPSLPNGGQIVTFTNVVPQNGNILILCLGVVDTLTSCGITDIGWDLLVDSNQAIASSISSSVYMKISDGTETSVTIYGEDSGFTARKGNVVICQYTGQTNDIPIATASDETEAIDPQVPDNGKICRTGDANAGAANVGAVAFAAIRDVRFFHLSESTVNGFTIQSNENTSNGTSNPKVILYDNSDAGAGIISSYVETTDTGDENVGSIVLFDIGGAPQVKSNALFFGQDY